MKELALRFLKFLISYFYNAITTPFNELFLLQNKVERLAATLMSNAFFSDFSHVFGTHPRLVPHAEKGETLIATYSQVITSKRIRQRVYIFCAVGGQGVMRILEK